MRLIIAILIMVLFAPLAHAKLFVAMNKADGSVQGTIDIQEDDIADWTQKYLMTPADESYRGLMPYEIKYQGNKLRKATEQEIEKYKSDLEVESLKKKKDGALATLGITDKDLEKLKKLPD